MKKKHYRDYATDAFRILALYGSSEKYKQRVISESREAASDLGTKIYHGVSSPTEAEVIRAQDALDEKMSTIADLEACADVLDHHIMEAIAYRNLDRPSYLGNNL